MTDIDKVLKLLSECPLSNYKIAQDTGLTEATIGNYRNGKTKPVPSYAKILLQYFSSTKHKGNDDQNLLSEANSEEKRKKIPLYDTETIGGTIEKRADVNTAAQVVEWIDAGDWFPDATAAIRHYGESMVEYPSGSILVLRRVIDNNLIIWGRNYSIETTEFRITKRLQDGGKDHVVAYSSNKETYPDGRQIHEHITIPKSTIRHIDLVLGCVTKEYSSGQIPIIKLQK